MDLGSTDKREIDYEKFSHYLIFLMSVWRRQLNLLDKWQRVQNETDAFEARARRLEKDRPAN